MINLKEINEKFEKKFQQMWSKTVNRLILTWKFKGANSEAQKFIKSFYRQKIITLLEGIEAELPKEYKDVEKQIIVDNGGNLIKGRYYCEGYNSAIKEMREKLNKMIKSLGEEIL